MVLPAIDAPARHVLAGGDDADEVDRRADRRYGLERAEDGRSARHVELHLVHAGRLLERNAARVESDALADEGDRCVALAAARVLENDEPRRLVRSARDRQERAHAKSADLPLLEHARAHGLVPPGEVARGLGEVARRADIRRQVREVLHERDARGNADPVADAALRGLGRRIRRDVVEARELRLWRLRRGLPIRDAVERVVHALDGVARRVVIVDARYAIGREPGRRAGGAALREPLRRSEHCATVGLAPEAGLRPEADEQDALGGAAPDAGYREGFRALAGEVPALQDARDGAAARPVDPPPGIGQDAAFVDAYDRAGGRLARRAGLDCVKLHDPRSPASRADGLEPVERAAALVYRVQPV
jgi:hypothetical protein